MLKKSLKKNLKKSLKKTLKRTKKQLGGDKDVKKWIINGKEIRCPHCLQNLFYMRKALLNTPGMTFFDLDAFNKNAYILKCQTCSMILWFNKKPTVNPTVETM